MIVPIFKGQRTIDFLVNKTVLKSFEQVTGN